jgi:hypothetical protein
MKRLAMCVLLFAVGCSGVSSEREAQLPAAGGGEGATPLTVTLRQLEDDSWVGSRFEVTIRNVSDGDIVISKPVDGSFWSWPMPYYQFVATDADGNELPLRGCCGNLDVLDDTEWAEDYVLTLGPGEAFAHEFHPPTEITEAGEYTVQFHYVMDWDNLTSWQAIDPLPAGAWSGTASSEPATYTLQPNQ